MSDDTERKPEKNNGEKQRFPISPEIITAVLNDADSHGETLEYAKEVLVRTSERHPALYKYLSTTAGQQGDFWHSYAISSVISYTIASRHSAAHGIEMDFTEEELRRHKIVADEIFNDPRWQDNEWVLERVSTKDGVDVDSGLGFFFNTLDAVAPGLAVSIADFTNKIEIPANRKHTLRGFFDGFMPFYIRLREDAEQN